MRVSDILRHKGTEVATVLTSSSIDEAIRMLAAHHIGALVVSDDSSSVKGVLSERDIVAHLAAVGSGGLETAVSDVMTSEVQTCCPTDSVESVMARMTEFRFRHLPVVVDGELRGIVSIGDAVERRMSALETERAQLHDYIQTGR